MGKRCEETLHQRNTEANKHVKVPIVVTKGMQIKSPVKYHYTSKWLQLKGLSTTSESKDAEHLLAGIQTAAITVETNLAIS
jgi:hypothetical protein